MRTKPVILLGAGSSCLAPHCAQPTSTLISIAQPDERTYTRQAHMVLESGYGFWHTRQANGQNPAAVSCYGASDDVAAGADGSKKGAYG